jgi:hypothetical protein
MCGAGGLFGFSLFESFTAGSEQDSSTRSEFLIYPEPHVSIDELAQLLDEQASTSVLERDETLEYVFVEHSCHGRTAAELSALDGVRHVEENTEQRLEEPTRSDLTAASTRTRQQATSTATTGGFVPNDPHFSEQWAPQTLNAPQAWEQFIDAGRSIDTLGNEVTIAILDTGVDYEHEDLEDRFRDDPGRDFVADDEDPSPKNRGERHGTMVAGNAAATINNATGTAGMVNAELIAGRVLDENVSGTRKDIADGIKWAVDAGADVINMSLYGTDGEAVRNALDYAADGDVVMVAASGNYGMTKEEIAYPATYDDVLGVGAIDEQENLTDFSQVDSTIVLAPGLPVLSPSTGTGGVVDGRYNLWDGTSAASPYVAGVAALLLAADDSLTASEITDIITTTARPIAGSSEGFDGEERSTGHGLVDANRAVAVALGNFADIADNKFAAEIRTLAEEGVISGYGDGTFRPERPVTRAEFAAMLSNAFDLEGDANDEFVDIDGHWGAGAIEEAARGGFLSGYEISAPEDCDRSATCAPGSYPKYEFRPNNEITKTEVLVSLSNGLEYSGGSWPEMTETYDDADEIPDWARQAIADAHHEWGVIESTPSNDRLTPNEPVTRAETAKYIYEATR